MAKVIYVSPNGFIGGAEKVVMQISRLHHSLRPEDVHILFLNPGSAADYIKQNQISVSVLKNSFRLSHPYKLLLACLEIRSILKREKIEIIHSTMAYGHLVMSLASLGLKMKMVWFQHGPVDGLLDKIASLFNSHLIFFNSDFLKQKHIASNFRWSSTKMKCIHLGIETPAAQLRELRIPLNIVMMGRISPSKGFDIVIKAVEILKNKKNDLHKYLKLTLVGESNFSHEKCYEDKLHNMSQNIKDIITFIPFQKDLTPIYQTHDILIQPSLIEEGFGLVLAEAMSFGLLVISPTYGGGTQIVKNKKTGIHFNFLSPEAPEKLSELLETLLINYSSYEEIKKNGQKLIHNEYTEKIMMKDIMDSYAEL